MTLKRREFINLSGMVAASGLVSGLSSFTASEKKKTSAVSLTYSEPISIKEKKAYNI